MSEFTQEQLRVQEDQSDQSNNKDSDNQDGLDNTSVLLEQVSQPQDAGDKKSVTPSVSLATVKSNMNKDREYIFGTILPQMNQSTDMITKNTAEILDPSKMSTVTHTARTKLDVAIIANDSHAAAREAGEKPDSYGKYFYGDTSTTRGVEAHFGGKHFQDKNEVYVVVTTNHTTGDRRPKADIIDTLVHETQHAVDYEGIITGAGTEKNPSVMKTNDTGFQTEFNARWIEHEFAKFSTDEEHIKKNITVKTGDKNIKVPLEATNERAFKIKEDIFKHYENYEHIVDAYLDPTRTDFVKEVSEHNYPTSFNINNDPILDDLMEKVKIITPHDPPEALVAIWNAIGDQSKAHVKSNQKTLVYIEDRACDAIKNSLFMVGLSQFFTRYDVQDYTCTHNFIYHLKHFSGLSDESAMRHYASLMSQNAKKAVFENKYFASTSKTYQDWVRKDDEQKRSQGSKHEDRVSLEVMLGQQATQAGPSAVQVDPNPLQMKIPETKAQETANQTNEALWEEVNAVWFEILSFQSHLNAKQTKNFIKAHCQIFESKIRGNEKYLSLMQSQIPMDHVAYLPVFGLLSGQISDVQFVELHQYLQAISELNIRQLASEETPQERDIRCQTDANTRHVPMNIQGILISLTGKLATGSEHMDLIANNKPQFKAFISKYFKNRLGSDPGERDLTDFIFLILGA